MKKILTSALASLVAISASTAYAGGPVIVTEEPMPVVEEQAGTSVGVLPLLLVGIALCVALCGGSDDDGRRVVGRCSEEE
jgi:hypothetical protein